MAKPTSFWTGPVLALALAAAPVWADETPTAESVVATVNGTDITVGHLILLRENLPQQYRELPDDVLFKGLLDQAISQTVLAQSLDGAEPARVRIAVENERRALLAGTVLDATLRDAVTEAAVEQAYAETYAKAAPETEFHAAHILVETEDEAKALIEELNAGADFAALAKQKSTGPSGPSGGDLGWFGKGMMVPPFEEAVAAMQPGTISAPVQTQFGWHVIKLLETRLSDAPPLDSVRADIEEGLRNRAIETRIDDLKAKATIDRTAETGFDPAIIRNLSLLEN
jgi:peptidyl-prolyl cis-trans isomerase C